MTDVHPEPNAARIVDQLRIVIQTALRPLALERRAEELDELLSLDCVRGNGTLGQCRSLVTVMRDVLGQDRLDSRLRRGYAVLFGTTEATADQSARKRREAAVRIIDPNIEGSGKEMESDTVLARREPKWRAAVADLLIAYNEEALRRDRRLPAGHDVGRLPGNREVGAIDAMREGIRGLQAASDPRISFDDFGIEAWNLTVLVNEEGTADFQINARITNLTETEKDKFEIPVWYDGDRVTADLLIDGAPLTVTADPWEVGRGGFLVIPLRPAVRARRTFQFECRYVLPFAFREGEEWFEWYFARSHSEFNLVFAASEEWRMQNVRASYKGTPGVIPSFRQPIVSFRKIEWPLAFPRRGCTYRLDWIMTRQPGVGFAGE